MSHPLNNVKGSCLCGAVTFEVAELDPEFSACHCSMCRQWGGGPLLAVDCQMDVHFHHEDAITTFASSEWAERGFCKHCGTHLFYRLVGSGQYNMPIGLFDLEGKVTFDHQIFVDQKPDYYDFANPTAMLTRADVFAEIDEEEDDHTHTDEDHNCGPDCDHHS